MFKIPDWGDDVSDGFGVFKSPNKASKKITRKSSSNNKEKNVNHKLNNKSMSIRKNKEKWHKLNSKPHVLLSNQEKTNEQLNQLHSKNATKKARKQPIEKNHIDKGNISQKAITKFKLKNKTITMKQQFKMKRTRGSNDNNGESDTINNKKNIMKQQFKMKRIIGNDGNNNESDNINKHKTSEISQFKSNNTLNKKLNNLNLYKNTDSSTESKEPMIKENDLIQVNPNLNTVSKKNKRIRKCKLERNTDGSKKKSVVNVTNKVIDNQKKHVESKLRINNNKQSKIVEASKNECDNNNDSENYDIDQLDELIISTKKKKLNQALKSDDNEDLLFTSANEDNNIKRTVSEVRPIQNKMEQKKNKFRTMLQTYNSNFMINKSNQLRERMLERLKAAQFRYLNEKLYTSSGTDAKELFRSDPVAFRTYHEGYQQQVKKWPVNPLDVIIKRIMKMPKTHKIADMGCGEAALSKRVPHSVRSFDLVAAGPGVQACDMAHTPLLSAAVDVAVYCLALMGTDLTQYLLEANRVLRMGGHLLIAEVESRFNDVDAFISDVQRLGFSHKKTDKSQDVFLFMEFTKLREPPAKKSKIPTLSLKPCLYKRR